MTLNRTGLNVGNVIKESVSLYRSNFLLFVTIGAMGSAFGILSAMVSFIPQAESTWFSLLLTPLDSAVTAWGIVAFIVAASNRRALGSITARECFMRARKHFWGYVGIELLTC